MIRDSESRISCGILWFDNEAEAQEAAAAASSRGAQFGRDRALDKTGPHGEKLFAVRIR